MSKNSPAETALQKETMIRLLEANYGNVTKAAKLAGITPQTHYRWRKEDSEYEKQTDSMKDLCYRDMKQNIIELALKKAQKGNVAVLTKLLGIFLKDLPEEMKILSRCNNVPLMPRIKYIDKAPWNEEPKELE